jgi:hypothetical protein
VGGNGAKGSGSGEPSRRKRECALLRFSKSGRNERLHWSVESVIADGNGTARSNRKEHGIYPVFDGIDASRNKAKCFVMGDVGLSCAKVCDVENEAWLHAK